MVIVDFGAGRSTVKLKIQETAWGIDRVAGGYRERVTADESFPCESGDIPVFGKGGRHFCIDEVSENKIVLSVRCADPKYDRTWAIKRGEEIVYRLRSFDGGYFYTFQLL